MPARLSRRAVLLAAAVLATPARPIRARQASPVANPAAAFAEGDGLAVWIDVVETDPERHAAVMDGLRAAYQPLATEPGFVSLTVHATPDRAKTVTVLQWEDEAGLLALVEGRAFAARAANYRAQATFAAADVYDLVAAIPTDGAAVPLAAQPGGVLVIDTIVAPKDQVERALPMNVANGEAFARDPASGGIAVLAGRGGNEVTYARWRSEQAFFAAFAALSGAEAGSMEAVDAAIAAIAGGAAPPTDYRAYEVAFAVVR